MPLSFFQPKSYIRKQDYVISNEVLGVGGYGEVKVAVQVATKKRFAVKIKRKRLIASLAYQIRMFEWFESSSKYYLIFELCPGGELFDRLIGETSFKETDARAVALTVYSVEGYGLAADLWSLGVVIFCLLGGRFPYKAQDDPVALALEARTTALYFPRRTWDAVSAEARDLVSKLLTVDQDQRITATDALLHPWFTSALPDVAPVLPMNPAATAGPGSAIERRRTTVEAVALASDVDGTLVERRPTIVERAGAKEGEGNVAVMEQ
ncbi:hypothetical protein RQP46_000640 [Phenoliferia psychrophenolica]